ncbi:2,3-dehydroadipyl-CoA hydratase [Litchfieldella qijiaojingensis]|uniref:2,3-dehydroadipyl-CoA hydratase n=1 Tax=Litchfieldella qijiaojingensis TaxID=980347 RepID=A0ABQ2YSJ4_9GAMM|nr:enoyl-CoA hydratase-related protein [Halomonas qijiaojingensis]GGX93984.1 2,3-dehydroadipyl-CoA hydratase [Halomonas qijiaojingensis]
MTDLLESRHDAGVVRLTLNRPTVRNALNTDLLGALASALDRAAQDETVRCVVVHGADSHFAAGADIDELAERSASDGPGDPRLGHWQRIQRFPKPLIAAVEGYCLGGGCELALCADLLVVANDAQLGQPEIRLGLIPGAGGLQRLAITLGKARTMHLVLTGERISGGQAYDWGLASQCCGHGEALDTALATAERLAEGPPLAQRLAKQAVLAVTETSQQAAFELGRRSFELLLSTDDKAEGIAAFRDKRPPSFSGK